MTTVRLTTGQAIINYLAQQHVERDGVEHRFFAGLWGIFGHGNIGGVAQAIQQAETEFPYYLCRNEQAMVHAAVGYAKLKNRLGAFACLTSIGPGRDQHGHRCRVGDHQPRPGAAPRGRRLRRARPVAGPPAAGAPGLAGHERERRVPPGRPLLGPHQPPRAGDHGPARGHARPDLARRYGRRLPRPAAGHPDLRLRLPRRDVREAGLVDPAQPARSRRRRGGRALDPREHAGRSSSPAVASATARRPTRCAPSRSRPGSRWPRPMPARAPSPTTTR